MPTWDKIRKEIAARARPDVAPRGDFDGVRREKLARLSELTGRHTILYASAITHTPKLQIARGMMSIEYDDKAGFAEVIANLFGDSADIILHSPGGSAEATESLVRILRSKFSSIRFIIPDIAKSAATMLAFSGDEVLMDEKSELGPIDPQMLIAREGQTITAPARAILRQFDKAYDEIRKDPTRLPVWLPILHQYGPSLLIECEDAENLAKTLVSEWVAEYMFRDDENAKDKATKVAEYLASREKWLSHGRRIGLEDLRQFEKETGISLKLVDLRDDPKLQQAVWDVYVATCVTFQGTDGVKIIENELGDAYIRNVRIELVPGPPSAPQPVPERAPKRPRKKRR